MVKSYFYPKQKVLCVSEGEKWGYGCPKKGEIYTIRQVKVYPDATYGLDLDLGNNCIYFFDGRHFKPVDVICHKHNRSTES